MPTLPRAIRPPIAGPTRGPGGAAPPYATQGGTSAWTPSMLGSALTIWEDQTTWAGSPIATANSRSPGVVNFSAAGAAQPSAATVNGLPVASFDGVNNDLSSSSLLSAAITAAAYTRFVVYQPGVITTNFADAAAYSNSMLVGDAGSAEWGPHLQGNSLAVYRHQAYHWDGAAKVAGVSGIPFNLGVSIVEECHYDGTTISATVAGQVATQAAGNVAAIGGGTQILHIGSPAKYPGKVCEVIVMNRLATATERAQCINYLTQKWSGVWVYPLTSYTNVRGNSENSPQTEYLFQSNAAFTAYRTAAQRVRVMWKEDLLGLGGYAAAGIMRDDGMGGVYGATEVATLTTNGTVGFFDSGWVTIGGSGTRDVYVMSGCRSGATSAKVVAVIFDDYAWQTTVQGQGTKDICFDCVGGQKLSDDAPTSFSALMTRFSAYDAKNPVGGIYFAMGRNDYTAAPTGSATFQTNAAAWLSAVRALGGRFATCKIVMQSLISVGSGEGANSAAYRTALQNVVTAAADPNTTYKDGSAIYSAADVNGDNVHPNTTSIQGQHRDAIVGTALGGVSTGWLMYGDSILAGSTSTVNANAIRGLASLLRIWRMTH